MTPFAHPAPPLAAAAPLTRVLGFEGYGDDTFGFVDSARPGDDYDNCANGKPIDWLVRSPSSGACIIVSGQYGRRAEQAGWSIGVAPVGEDGPLPPWPMRIIQGECSYSPLLEVTVPDDVEIIRLLEQSGRRS